MEFATDINADKIDLYFYEDGHKVGDYSLTQDEAIILTKKLMGSIARQRGGEHALPIKLNSKVEL